MGILLQFAIILSSIFIEDESNSLMLITTLLGFEFVISTFFKPFVTASDRLCQFTLRSFVLFESSVMVLVVNGGPLNVAVSSVAFVTLITSQIAACSGLYPIHPNNTVFSRSCCCCFCILCCCNSAKIVEDSDDEEYVENSNVNSKMTYVRMTTQSLNTNTNTTNANNK